MTKYSVVCWRTVLFLRIVICRIRFWRGCFSGGNIDLEQATRLGEVEWDHSFVEGSACYKAYCPLLFGRVQVRILPGDLLSRPGVFVAFLMPSRQCWIMRHIKPRPYPATSDSIHYLPITNQPINRRESQLRVKTCSLCKSMPPYRLGHFCV